MEYCSIPWLERLSMAREHPPLHPPPSVLIATDQFSSTHLHSWVGRGEVKVKCLAQEHVKMTQPGLKLRLIDYKSPVCIQT